MYGFNEDKPAPERSPHEEFSYRLYEAMKGELKNILPGKIINTGYMCRGDRSISKLSFTGQYGEPLHPDDWNLLKEYTCSLYAEKIIDDAESLVTNENTKIIFTEGDPEYNDTQTITITHIKQE